MATKPFKPRRILKSKAVSLNPVLEAGEFIMEVPDTGVGTGQSSIKMGDGKTDYKNLPYAIESGAAVYEYTQAEYDALNNAEKEKINGIVVITDADDKGLSAVDVTYDNSSGETECKNLQTVVKELYGKYNSFNDAKGSIIISALGQALGFKMDEETPENTTSWDEIVKDVTSILCFRTQDYTGTNDITLQPGFYAGGTIKFSTAYNQGKQEALKVAGGLQVYPAANGVNWTGNATTTASGKSEAANADGSCITNDLIDLTNASSVTAMVNANCNPTRNGTGKYNSLGSGSASLRILQNGVNVKYADTSFGHGVNNVALVVDVSALKGSCLIQMAMHAYSGFTSNTKGRKWGAASTISMTSCKVN